jgi:uncharacterized protein YrzB (UPF0473 family)
MSEDEDQDLDIVRMADDNGVERDFALLAVFEIDGNEYAVLAPAEQLDNTEEPSFDLYAFHYREDGDEVELDAVEDEALLERIFDMAERELFGDELSEE